ncbi:MAG TPA: hypothetical protein VNQ73_16020 [Ilumatobacter sp.]|nr:hypothetical protein [Ilumatobacter sp.]
MNALVPVGSMTTNFTQHDLSPDGAEMLTGIFTPAGPTIEFAVASALSNLGTARAALLLYVGQPDVPGTRLYDAGAQPIPAYDVQTFSVGSVGCETGWALTSYRTVRVDVDPDKDVTWTVLAAILGAANIIPTGTNPVGLAITPNGTKAYISNSSDGTVTSAVLGRPGYSVFNELQPQDEAVATIAVGASPLGVACNDSIAVVCNFDDSTNRVTVIDVATDTVLRHSALASGQHATSVAISPDGLYAYVATYEGVLFRVTIADGSSTSVAVSAGNELRGVAVSETAAYVGNHATGEVHRVPLPDMTSPASTSVGGNPVAVRLAPDGVVWVASRGTNTLRSISADGVLAADYTLPFGDVNDFAISPPVAPPVVPADEAQPVRTAYVGFDDNKWCQFNIGGDFAGEAHTIHRGDLPGAASPSAAIAVNDYGEIWIVQTALDRVWKFPGGRIYCRAGTTPAVLYGEYLDVFATAAAEPGRTHPT